MTERQGGPIGFRGQENLGMRRRPGPLHGMRRNGRNCGAPVIGHPVAVPTRLLSSQTGKRCSYQNGSARPRYDTVDE